MRSVRALAPVFAFITLSLFLLTRPALLPAAEDTSLDAIQQRGILRVGMDIPYGVMEYYDQEGKPAGIDVDIARAIAARLGTQVSFQSMPFSELFDALHSGKVDLLLSAVTITPSRQQSMRFSSPYMDVGLSIAVRAGATGIRSEADLDGKRIGVLKGTTGEEYARASRHIDPALIQTYSSNPARLRALTRGEIDAAIVHFTSAEIPGVSLVGKPLTQSYYGVVSRLQDRALMDAVEATLRGMKHNGRLVAIKQSHRP